MFNKKLGLKRKVTLVDIIKTPKCSRHVPLQKDAFVTEIL